MAPATRRYLMKKANILLALAFIALIAGCLFGCKAVEKYKASPQFAADCGDRFPPRTTPGKPDTVTLAGITIDCDSVVAANKDTVRLTNVVTIERLMPTSTGNRVTCPPQILITQTDTIYNTAREQALISQLIATQTAHDLALQKAGAQKEKLQGKLGTRSKQRNWLFWIIVAFIAGTQRHRIIKLFSNVGKN